MRTVKSKEARAQLASGTQHKEKEDKSELLQKRIHVLTAQNNKLTALLRNENSHVKGMQIGMEGLDPVLQPVPETLDSCECSECA